jgi:hypothetical protein
LQLGSEEIEFIPDRSLVVPSNTVFANQNSKKEILLD